jgi:uncharacterized protein (UPF0147 family)
MRGSTPVRVAVTVALLVAAVVAYRSWTSAERQIRRSISEAASALNHDEPATSLSAIAAVSVLNAYLAPDVSMDRGGGSAPLIGRQEVVATAARLRVSTPMMRVQLFDEEISLVNASAAIVHLTAQMTTRDHAGEELADARRVIVELVKSEGRWLVSRVTLVQKREPAS